jgi:hypothetical protein
LENLETQFGKSTFSGEEKGKGRKISEIKEF